LDKKHPNRAIARNEIEAAILSKTKKKPSWGLMAHTCNPNYSGGRDQENWGLKLSQGKEFVRTYLENTHQEMAGRMVITPS
jgi:hypothetical protein